MSDRQRHNRDQGHSQAQGADLYQQIMQMKKEDLTLEERKALQDCADNMAKQTSLYSSGLFLLSYFVTRQTSFPLIGKVLINSASFLIGGYGGMIRGSEDCTNSFMKLENSKIGDLIRSTKSGQKPSLEKFDHEEIDSTESREEGTAAKAPPKPQRLTRLGIYQEEQRRLEKIEREQDQDANQSDFTPEKPVSQSDSKRLRRNQYGDIVED